MGVTASLLCRVLVTGKGYHLQSFSKTLVMAHHVCKASQNKEVQFHLPKPVSLEKDLQREQEPALWLTMRTSIPKPGSACTITYSPSIETTFSFPNTWSLTTRKSLLLILRHIDVKNIKIPVLPFWWRKAFFASPKKTLYKEVPFLSSGRKATSNSLSNKIISVHSMVWFEALSWKILTSLIWNDVVKPFIFKSASSLHLFK